MLNHDFTAKTTRQLFDLRRQIRSTLSNPNCHGLEDGVNNTIKQIDSELETRGILSIIKPNDVIYITNSLNQ